jgi:hypothetical protein
MTANTIPDNKERDAIIAERSGGGSSPKRADTLNGEPRTKSASHGGPNFSSHTTSDIGKAPPPNNPYRK